MILGDSDRNRLLPFTAVKRSGWRELTAVQASEFVTGRKNPETATVSQLIEAYIEATAKGRHTGNYRTLAKSALNRFQRFSGGGETPLSELDESLLRSFAQSLRRSYRDGELAASTARTYFATVRACLEWGVEDGLLSENPAASERARGELPDDTTEPDRQFWSPDDVEALLSDLTNQIDQRLADEEPAAVRSLTRDRAMVSVLAFAGVRGAEIFDDTDDDRDGRQGLRWNRVDLDGSALKVLGKSQTWEWAQLPPQARDHLARHRQVQEPASDDWPVFQTGHAPSKHAAVRETLAARDWEREKIETLLDSAPIGTVLREHDIPPPAISIRGARTVLKRRCEDAEVAVNGEYLKPHGARRGLGDVLYRESAELAQSALRHASIRTTHEAYSHIDASETADTVGSVLDDALDGADSNEE